MTEQNKDNRLPPACTSDHGDDEPSSVIPIAERALYHKMVAALIAPIRPEHPDRNKMLQEVTSAVKPPNIFDTYWICYVILWQWDVMRMRQVRTNVIKGDWTALFELPDEEMRIALAIETKHKLIKHLNRIVAAKEKGRDAALRRASCHCASLGALLRRAVDEAEERFSSARSGQTS